MEKRIKKRRLRPVHIITLSFLILITVGTFLLWLPISHYGDISFVSAIFTATSATCLTGLNVLPLNTYFTTFGQVVILILIQLGGLGLMTFATMVLMFLRKRFTIKDRLVMQEALGHNQNKGVVKLTRRVTAYVLICELVGTIALLPYFVKREGARGIFSALFISVSAFCNAGFENLPYSESLTAFSRNPYVLLVVAFLMILGGIGFAVALDLGRNKFRLKKCYLHTKLVIVSSSFLIVFGTVMFLVGEYSNPNTLGNMGFGYKLLNSFFQSITCRTTGFITFDQSLMSAPSKMLSMVFMFIGGSPASAAGGIKTTTIAIVILMLVAGLKHKSEVVVFGRTINKKTCLSAAAVFVIGIIAVMTLSMLLMFSEKGVLGTVSLDQVIFEAMAAFSTTGLTQGLTEQLSGAGKVIVSLAMLVGKIGAVSIGALFFNEHNEHDNIRYPEGYVLIG